MRFTDSELATMLDALRHFQRTCMGDPTDEYPDYFADADPLDFDGEHPGSIDEFCERLNVIPDDEPAAVRDLIALDAASRKYVHALLDAELCMDYESRHLTE